jgi:hypothetical protein
LAGGGVVDGHVVLSATKYASKGEVVEKRCLDVGYVHAAFRFLATLLRVKSHFHPQRIIDNGGS